MIMFLSAEHKNIISVPQKNINRNRKMVSPTPPLKKHFLVQKRYPRRVALFWTYVNLFVIFDTAYKAKHFIFSSKDRRYARFDSRIF